MKHDPRVITAIRRATTDELETLIAPFMLEAMLMLDVQPQRTRDDVLAEAEALGKVMGTPTRTLCLEAARQVFLVGERVDADENPQAAGQLGLRLAGIAVLMDQLAKQDANRG